MGDAADSERKLARKQLKKRQKLAKPDVMLVTKNVMIPVVLSPPSDKLFPAEFPAKNKLKMLRVQSNSSVKRKSTSDDPEKPSFELAMRVGHITIFLSDGHFALLNPAYDKTQMRASIPTTKPTHGKPIRNSTSSPTHQILCSDRKTSSTKKSALSQENKGIIPSLPTHLSTPKTNVQSTVNHSSPATSSQREQKCAELELSIQSPVEHKVTASTPSNSKNDEFHEQSAGTKLTVQIPKIIPQTKEPKAIMSPEVRSSGGGFKTGDSSSAKLLENRQTESAVLRPDPEEKKEPDETTLASTDESNCSKNFGNGSGSKIRKDFEPGNNSCCSERESEIKTFNYSSFVLVDDKRLEPDQCTVSDRPGQNTGLVNVPATENLAGQSTPENQDEEKGTTDCQPKYSWQDLSSWVPPSKKSANSVNQKRDGGADDSFEKTNELECKIVYSWQIIGMSTQTSPTIDRSSPLEAQRLDEANRCFYGISSEPFECKIKYSWQIIGASAQASLSEDQSPGLSDEEYWKGTLLAPSKELLKSEPGSWKGLRAATNFHEERELKRVILHSESTQTVRHRENQTELLDSNGCEVKYSWENLIRRYVKRRGSEKCFGLKDNVLREGEMEKAKAVGDYEEIDGRYNVARETNGKESCDTFNVCNDISDENLEIIFEASENGEEMNEGEDVLTEAENRLKDTVIRQGSLKNGFILTAEVKRNFEDSQREKGVKESVKTELEEMSTSSLNFMNNYDSGKTRSGNADVKQKEITMTDSPLEEINLPKTFERFENLGQKKSSTNDKKSISNICTDLTYFQDTETQKSNKQNHDTAENNTYQISKVFQDSVHKKTPFDLQREKVSIKRMGETMYLNKNPMKELSTRKEILEGICPSLLHDARHHIIEDILPDDLDDFKDNSMSEKSYETLHSGSSESIESMDPESLVKKFLSKEVPLLEITAFLSDVDCDIKHYPSISTIKGSREASLLDIDNSLHESTRPCTIDTPEETDSKVENKNAKSTKSMDPDNISLNEEASLVGITASISDVDPTVKIHPSPSIPRTKETAFENVALKEIEFSSLNGTNDHSKIDGTPFASGLKATNFPSASIRQPGDSFPENSASPAVEHGTSVFLSLAGYRHEVIERSCEREEEDMDQAAAATTDSTSGNNNSCSDGCFRWPSDRDLLKPGVRADVCDATESGDGKTRKKELLSRLDSAIAKLKRSERRVEANWCFDNPLSKVVESAEGKSEGETELTEEAKKDIRGIAQSAEEYIGKLEEQLKDLNTADEQIICCSEKTLNDIDETYQTLIDDVCREINQRRSLVRLETEVYKNEGLAPLKACRQEVNAQIRNTRNLIAMTETVLQKPDSFSKERFNRIVSASSNMGRIPAVPMIEELPYVTFSSPSTELRSEVLERIARLGCVLRMGPAQLTEVLERPACLLVKWHVADPEYAAEEHTFLLQKAAGDVLDPTSTAFKTVYAGPETSCFVRDLPVDQAITLRVGIQVADTAWSVHRRAKTTIPAYTWELGNKNYMITNLGRIAAKITDDISTVLSRGAQFSADHIIEFKFLEATKGTNDEGVALVSSPSNSDDTLKRSGALLITTQGKIYMDGEEKLMQLPRMRFGTRITFTAEQKSAETLRMNIECDDKAVTYDWTVKTPLHFAARFTEYNKWNLMVK